MSFPFDESTKSAIAGRCAAFVRLPGDPAHALKAAAVAITLTDTDDGSGETALILTGARRRFAVAWRAMGAAGRAHRPRRNA